MQMFLFFIFLSLSLSSHGGVFKKSAWTKQELKVCFVPFVGKYKLISETLKLQKWTDEDKKLIRETILAEYTPDQTIIHFIGFEDCIENDDSDVIVFYHKTKDYYGQALMGPFPAPFDEKFPNAHSYVILTKKGFTRGTIVHEFGHVTGLAHEHLHPDAASVEHSCKYVNPNITYQYRFNYTKYDPESIMNYCVLEKDRSRGLSSEDIKNIRSLYQLLNF